MCYEMPMLESWQVGDLEVRIYQDIDPVCPREWDNLGTLALYRRFHDRYLAVGEEVIECPDHLAAIERKAAVHLPVYAYVHSGVAVQTRPFHCAWDSGFVGIIYVSREKLLAEYGGKRLTRRLKEKAKEVLEGEIQTLNQYLTGDVYGYAIVRKTTCNLGYEHEETVDSCWGFYGYDWVKQEAQEAAEHFTKGAA